MSTKVVVLGESGVGKSTLVNTLCGLTRTPDSTVGASVSITWHEYRAGSTEQRTEMIELWDIGGASAHRPASTVFLDGAAGVLLVHDLSNSKSEANLGQWMSLLNGDRRVPSSYSARSLLTDIESFHMPLLLVGCKLDLAPHRARQLSSSHNRVFLDCRKEIPPGSSSAMILSRFFDACIDRTRAPPGDRRRRVMLN